MVKETKAAVDQTAQTVKAAVDQTAQTAQTAADQTAQTAQTAANQAAQATKSTVNQAAQTIKEESPLVVSAGGKLVLAAIGAVGLAQDSLEHLLNRMVERGELSQKDARKLVTQLRTKRPNPFSRRMQNMANSMPKPDDLPTKADIDSLHDEIAELSAKLDRLNAVKQGSPKP